VYHQKKDGTFEDVTISSGLKDGYGMGVAVGDFDNDGYEDLYVTAYGGNRLYHKQSQWHLHGYNKAVRHRRRGVVDECCLVRPR